MFDNYTVLVKIAMQNELSKGLLLMSGQFTKLNQQADLLHSKLQRIKSLAFSGGIMAGAGFAGLAVIAKTVKPAADYAHQLAQMNVSGMKHLEIVKATQAAWAGLKSTPTSSVTENLASIQHLRMVFGDTQHAIENMPVVQQIQGLLKSVKGARAGDESYEVAKALEMKGAVKTPDMFKGEANLMAKAIIASGGKVGASDFLSTFKYGRSATTGWSDDFTYKILPTLIQEMKTRGGSGGGGGGPGNALQSAYAAVVGGTVPQKALKVWQNIGMLDPSKVVWNKVGGAKGVAPGGIKGSEEFIANPYVWTQKYLVPSLIKAGYTTEAQQKQALQYLFPNRTAGFVMSQFVTQGWKFERDKKLIDQASGLEGYQKLLKNDPMLAQQALHAQWQSLLAILGYQLMPTLISGATKLTEGLMTLSLWVRNNEGKAKALMYAFAGLSTTLAISGTVLLITAGFAALKYSLALLAAPVLALSAPVLGITAAIGLLVYGLYKLWETLKSFFTTPLTAGQQQAIANGGPVALGAHAMTPGDMRVGFNPARLGFGGINTVKGAGRAPQAIQVASTINLDGRSIGKAVTEHIVGEASKPANHSGLFDVGMTQTPPMYNLRGY
jgi:hypothetical protein